LSGPDSGIAAGGGELLDLPGLEQHLFGLGDDARADVGDLHVGGAALEERDRQLILELLDGHRQGRLADIAALGGMPEMTLAGQRHEIAKIGKRHEAPAMAIVINYTTAKGPGRESPPLALQSPPFCKRLFKQGT
jgi:hypothetical protein